MAEAESGSILPSIYSKSDVRDPGVREAVRRYSRRQWWTPYATTNGLDSPGVAERFLARRLAATILPPLAPGYEPPKPRVYQLPQWSKRRAGRIGGGVRGRAPRAGAASLRPPFDQASAGMVSFGEAFRQRAKSHCTFTMRFPRQNCPNSTATAWNRYGSRWKRAA